MDGILIQLNQFFLYILDTTPTLRWNSTGITIAGVTGVSSTVSGYLERPRGIKLDSSNTLYIADFLNNRVQKWPFGAWFGITVAGYANGTSSSGSEGLANPSDIVIDMSGGIYIPENTNCRVQYWGNDASIGSTVAGTGWLLRNNFSDSVTCSSSFSFPILYEVDD